MTSPLSQDEIDQLLTAINAGVTEDFRPAANTRKIKIYDFMRPDKFSKDQIRTMAMVHGNFARLITTSLSARLRSCVHAHVASADQLTYEEFIRSIPTPTTLGAIEMPPLKGSIVMEIDPALSSSMIDLIFGGYGNAVKNQHELTLIEQSVIKNLFPRLLEDLRNSWAHIVDLHPKLARLETNPQFIQVVPPSEMVILVVLETKIGDTEGVINIVYPYSVIAPIAKKLYPLYGRKSQDSNYISNCRMRDSDLSPWEEIPVKLKAEVLRRDYSIREVLNWNEETILLPLCPLIPNHCYLRLGDRRLWQCKILEDQKRFLKKIQIIGTAEKPFGTEGIKMQLNELNKDVADALANVNVTVHAELGTAEMPIKQLLGMGEGTIIELDKQAGEAVDIKANGVVIAKGEVVVIEENFGIRVIEMLANFNSLGQTEEKQEEPTEAGS